MPPDFLNSLLSRLGEPELRALRPHLVPVVLNRGDVLTDANGSNDCLYFVETGVIRIVARLSDRESVTVALTGRKGVGGAETVLSAQPLQLRPLVLVPGSAFRLDATLLRRERSSFPLILDGTERYVQVLIAQIAQSAICNRYHLGRERLARWLLLTGDHAGTRRLPLTHRTLAEMVGGARTLVTGALMELREQGAIDYRRGVVILKRGTLVKQACECYGSLKQTLARYEIS